MQIAYGFGDKKENNIPTDSWTKGRIHSFIVSVLRTGSRKWPPKYNVLNKAFSGVKTNEKTGRQAKHFKCNQCKNHFVVKDVEVDHIKPVIDPKRGFVSWNEYIERLFCAEENLQVLCKPCHKIKTANEKEISMYVLKKKKGTK